ncbi:MAG: surface lipoprotein assembly modifier [Rhodospirillaceae bacterium]|nr:surface lipoprotein assembly modifier [Rhodospirillaceae bacterium]
MEAVEEAGTAEGDEREELLDEAIASFREMLVADPALVRVRLELARAFYLKGEDRLAKRHFERVLAGGVPGNVAANVNRYLAEIRARRRWEMHAGFALAPDTNIGGSSDQRIIYIYGLPFERDAEDLATSGIGLSAWTGGEYQHPLRDRLRLRAGASVSRREYSGNRFDQTFVSGHAGPRWLIGRNTEASLLASVQRRWSAGAPDHDALGGRLEAGHRFGRRVTAHAGASWHDRSYRTRDYLDGPAADVSLGGSVVVTPTVRADAGLGWGRERPETERWRHERRWVRGGVTVALPRGFTVGASAEYREADYEGNWFPHTEGEPREDRTHSLRASVHNRAFAWKGFSPQLSLVHEVRKTNAQLYDYERTGGELRFVKLF